MSRSAGLLLILGLALGLWVGFNPQAHQQAVQSWDRAKSSYVSFQSQAGVKVQKWTSNLDAHARVNSGPAQPVTTSKTLKEASSALDTFWNSVQRMWSNLTAQISPNV